MSNTVTLNASAVSAQKTRATATVTDNGVAVGADIVWATSDASIATVDSSGLIFGVADSSGTGSKEAVITATAVVNGNTVSGTGLVTVVTTGDTVLVTVDFSAPQ